MTFDSQPFHTEVHKHTCTQHSLSLLYAHDTRVGCLMQGYAWEITTVEGGWGLHGVLQQRQGKLNGITNGIDMKEWDPEHDEHTAAPYSAKDLAGEQLRAVFAGVPTCLRSVTTNKLQQRTVRRI